VIADIATEELQAMAGKLAKKAGVTDVMTQYGREHLLPQKGAGAAGAEAGDADAEGADTGAAAAEAPPAAAAAAGGGGGADVAMLE
jgi:hypothetical protein